MKPIAYVFLDRNRDWECAVTATPSDFEDDPDWYLAAEVNSLDEVYEVLEDHGFDYEYFYNLVERMPHRLYNLLNK